MLCRLESEPGSNRRPAIPYKEGSRDAISQMFAIAMLYEKEGEKNKAIYYYRQAMKFDENYDDAKKAHDALTNSEVDHETEKILEIEPYKSKINFSNIVGMDDIKSYLKKNIDLPYFT